MSLIREDIWERPPGVSASPRKISVTTLTSLESPNNSSISFVAVAIGCPGGRNATSAPSVGSARKRGALDQNNGDDKEHDERDIRAGRYYPAQSIKNLAHGAAFSSEKVIQN